MSNIDKQALRADAVRAGGVKWQYMRATQHSKAYITDDKGSTVVNCTDGDVPANCAGFLTSANPATVLVLLDELEAKDRMVAELLNIISNHTIELGWGEKPITLAELIISREGSGSDALDAIRIAAAGKGEAS